MLRCRNNGCNNWGNFLKNFYCNCCPIPTPDPYEGKLILIASSQSHVEGEIIAALRAECEKFNSWDVTAFNFSAILSYIESDLKRLGIQWLFVVHGGTPGSPNWASMGKKQPLFFFRLHCKNKMQEYLCIFGLAD